MSDASFEGVIEAGPGGGSFISLPAAIVAQLGATRCRVTGTLNGEPFASSTMPTGGGGSGLGIHKATRLAAGVQPGDTVRFVVRRDDTPRVVDIPSALAAALQSNPGLDALFNGLAFSHRREFAEWVAGAKRDDTRARRVERVLETLRDRAKGAR